MMSGSVGKVGLALSGGGMRAALCHIGVLARLAELDALRHIDVISCVSGGSIVGAYYYMKLKLSFAAAVRPYDPDHSASPSGAKTKRFQQQMMKVPSVSVCGCL
jgi:predicted acylesterase/phospholipase RssA